MKNLLLPVLGLILISLLSYLLFTYQPKLKPQFNPQINPQTIQIGDTNIKVSIANTPETLARGLSGKESLGEGEGMLFVFDKSDKYGFWMKEMNFAIDIVWIDESREIIGVEKNIEPETFPKTFYPDSPIKYALELPSGYALKHHIDTGKIMYFESKN